jgi:hypothetical protein
MRGGALRIQNDSLQFYLFVSYFTWKTTVQNTSWSLPVHKVCYVYSAATSDKNCVEGLSNLGAVTCRCHPHKTFVYIFCIKIILCSSKFQVVKLLLNSTTQEISSNEHMPCYSLTGHIWCRQSRNIGRVTTCLRGVGHKYMQATLHSSSKLSSVVDHSTRLQ